MEEWLTFPYDQYDEDELQNRRALLTKQLARLNELILEKQDYFSELHGFL